MSMVSSCDHDEIDEESNIGRMKAKQKMEREKRMSKETIAAAAAASGNINQ